MASYLFTLHWKSEPSYFMQPEASVGSPCSSSSMIAKQCPFVLEETYHISCALLACLSGNKQHKLTKNPLGILNTILKNSPLTQWLPHSLRTKDSHRIFKQSTIKMFPPEYSVSHFITPLQDCSYPATHMQLFRNEWEGGKVEILLRRFSDYNCIG